MTETSPLQRERKDGVLELRLDRPQVYNAIDPELRQELIGVLESVESDGTRAILLYGSGRGFCSGTDLKAVTRHPGIETTRTLRLSTQRLVRTYLDCPIPIVTAVHGVAAGIGLTLACGAAVCVASTDATFRSAFVQRAMVPDGAVSYLLPRLIGLARAKDFLLRGHDIDGPRAVEIGLIAESVAPDDLLAHARGIAQELAGLPTATVSLIKELLGHSLEADLETFLLYERLAQGVSSVTEDAAEGRRAFGERRAPNFVGR